MTSVSFVTQAFSILTVVGQVIIALFLISLIFRKKSGSFLDFFAKHALSFSFIVSFFAMAASLFYSEIAGFEPCKLCWLIRIFMFPQVIIFGIALLRKDAGAALYGIALSAIGATIAAYQYLLQIGVLSTLPCSAVGYSASCSEKFVMQFGYITIPMMALTAFLLILSFGILSRLKK